ncbi:Exocyst complex component sec15 like protein [Verticillium longisporum]|nr:Exocyst complex component sec15 like protein [Verticillium longisporum]
MPRRVQNYDDYGIAVQEIIVLSSNADFLDQLIPVLKDASSSGRTPALLQTLSQYSEDREADIERIGLTKHEEFLGSVTQLQQIREGTVTLTAEILELNESIQSSTEKLADQKRGLVNTRAVRQNIADASNALQDSLRILYAVNNAHELIRKKKYYAALKSLEDLQNEHLVPIIQNKYATQHKLADVIQKSIPQSQKSISEAVMTDLNTWLFRIPEDENSLSSLLEGVAGFAIVEKATMRRTPNLRSIADVDELWDSMCHTAIGLTSTALDEVSNAEVLLKIKGVMALFIQTMEGWGYSVTALDAFLLTLFDKYAELLKRRFSEDFQEIVSTDDYMPMAINSREEYEKVVNVSWFSQDKSPEDLSFPCVLPFSQMYPLCCIDIRNFLNQFYFFSDDHFQHSNIIDETLRKSLDELLTDKVCKSLVERLSSQYLGQIVQILINLEHFEAACQELEQLLIRARSSTSAGGPVTLDATEQFRNNKKTAEKRIFELVNSKIDDLVDTAEYDWMTSTAPTDPSNYMQTLTRYLSNIMNSTLLGLPREIKELIYFDALSHAANKILALPLSSEVKHINTHAVSALAVDVHYLTEFVDSLENGAMLRENLDELQQTVNLLQSDNHDEFFDISIRNKKFGRVDALNGPMLLEKLTTQAAPLTRTAPLSNFSSRFGMMK